MKKIILIIFTTFLLYGCLSREKCTLPPIPANVFDISKITGKNIMLTSGRDIDSLVYLEKHESYQEESLKGIAVHKECEHTKSYEYSFRGEPLPVYLRKDNEEKLTLELYGFFNTNTEISVTESDILKNKEFIFPSDSIPNDKSPIKEIVLKGYKIKSITTIDNKKWTPKEMF